MRLIRNKIFRAIPELDRFSDNQCRHFVISANSSWRRRLLRWCTIGVASFVGVFATMIGAVFVTGWLHDLIHTGEILANTIAIVVATVAIAPVLVATLVLRDYLLRLTIRRLIRRCGTCPKCQYSLLGMRLSPDHTVICPECGLKVDVDPALGDLATDESGAAVYKPEVARIHKTTAEARRRRHRHFFKWTGISIAGLMLILFSTVGIWWLQLNLQANRAIAERDGVSRIRELQIAMWPIGSTTDSAAEFAEYFSILADCSGLQIPALNPSLTNGPPSTTATVYFEATTLIPSAGVATFEATSGAGSFAASREYTLAAIDHARKSGLTDRLRTLASLKAPIREMAQPSGGPLVGVQLMDLGKARATSRFNNARMIDALNRADRAEYMDAMEVSLAIEQIVGRQGLLLDHLVAISIRSHVLSRVGDDLSRFPEDTWVEDAIAILQRQNASVPLTAVLEVERVFGLDAIQWYFADPKRVAKAQLGIGEEDPLIRSWPGFPAPKGSIGSYQRNRDAWNSSLAASSAVAAISIPTNRPALPGPSGLTLVDMLGPSLSRALSSEIKLRYDYNQCLITLASDLFRRKNGRFPTGPDEIAPLLADRSVLTDPLTGKPFRFIVRDESGKDGRSFEIRSGADEETAPREPPKPQPDTTSDFSNMPGETQ